jgi:hypothetical protein
MTKTVKIFFSEEDAEDMASSFHKEVGEPIPLWNTWSYTDPITGELTEIEMYLGNEDDEDTSTEIEDIDPRYQSRCSHSNCDVVHSVGSEIRYSKSYETFCDNGICSEDINTIGSTTLEPCWWGDKD